MATVLVIGAGGVLGGLVAEAFAEAGWDVRRASRRPAGEPGACLVDLDRPETLASALEGADVAVSTVPHPRLTAERHVLEHGGTLLSVVAFTPEEARPLRELASRARGTVVLNAGLMPGVTNLVAAELLHAHPQADGLELAMTASTSGTMGRAGGAFGYENVTTRRRHRTAEIALPPPFGTRTCPEFAEGCDGWLGALAEGRDVHSYLCFAERLQHEALLLANRLGACRALPRSRFVVEHRPGRRGASRNAVAEWVAVARGGSRLAAATVECEGDYRGTAAAALVFAERLLEDGRASGCFDVHELIGLDEVAARLEEEGVRVVEQQAG
jgi:hypothetical protein